MPSTGYAFCLHSRIQTRSRNPPTASYAARSLQRMPAWLPCVGGREFLPAASSGPYSPAEAGAPLDICHVVGPVPLRLATVAPAASSAAAEYCETDPTGAAVARLPQESMVRYSGSLSDAPRRLTELNKAGCLESRTLLENSRATLRPTVA